LSRMRSHSTRPPAIRSSRFVTIGAHGRLRGATGLRPHASRMRRPARRHQGARAGRLSPGRGVPVWGAFRTYGERPGPRRRASPGGAGRLPGLSRLPPRSPPALVSVPDGLRQDPGSYCLQARECVRFPLVVPLLLPQDHWPDEGREHPSAPHQGGTRMSKERLAITRGKRSEINRRRHLIVRVSR